MIKETIDRWNAKSPIYFERLQKYATATIASIGGIYGTLATLQATSFYTAPTWLTKVLQGIVTFFVGVLFVAKLPKIDFGKDVDVSTPQAKIDTISEIIDTPNQIIKSE